jgi:hypothetical protein
MRLRTATQQVNAERCRARQATTRYPVGPAAKQAKTKRKRQRKLDQSARMCHAQAEARAIADQVLRPKVKAMKRVADLESRVADLEMQWAQAAREAREAKEELRLRELALAHAADLRDERKRRERARLRREEAHARLLDVERRRWFEALKDRA